MRFASTPNIYSLLLRNCWQFLLLFTSQCLPSSLYRNVNIQIYINTNLRIFLYWLWNLVTHAKEKNIIWVLGETVTTRAFCDKRRGKWHGGCTNHVIKYAGHVTWIGTCEMQRDIYLSLPERWKLLLKGSADYPCFVRVVLILTVNIRAYSTQL